MSSKKIICRIIFLLLLLFPLLIRANNYPPDKEYYSILIYHLKDAGQETRLDAYLKEALLPAAHRSGITRVGVFKPTGNDTAADRRVYVFLPGRSPEQLLKLPQQLTRNSDYTTAGKDYIDAAWDNPVYIRIETVILEAFSGMPKMEVPVLKSAKNERVYELRSYESSSEKLHLNKVDMFNKGEVDIFRRLGFNAVFYAVVLSGSQMPNLMYMTSFENLASRQEHWKAFSNDPVWQEMRAKPEYGHNNSHSDIILLHPAEYSDI
jgi:hypothetical protein